MILTEAEGQESQAVSLTCHPSVQYPQALPALVLRSASLPWVAAQLDDGLSF